MDPPVITPNITLKLHPQLRAHYATLEGSHLNTFTFIHAELTSLCGGDLALLLNSPKYRKRKEKTGLVPSCHPSLAFYQLLGEHGAGMEP